MSTVTTAIVWFRRDLRLHDHPALRAALAEAERVVPAFCLDDRLLHGRHASPVRTQFLLDCLADLDAALRERGSGLVLRHGPPERELPALARETEASALHFSGDVTPYARSRGKRVREAFADEGVELVAHPGLCAVDRIGELRTQAGKPYTIFTPFHRNWERVQRREVLGAPRKLPPLPARLRKGRVPSLDALGLEHRVEQPPPGGEREARERLRGFLARDVKVYGEGRDELGEDTTSRLSPYLRFGCISPREVEARLPRGAGPEAFRRQLCWRDFHQQVLLHFPENAHAEFQQRYRGMKWSRARVAFERWCEGRTGYPLVDAGMRQLRQEGWMHNRARLVVGSFLTKDLGIDWRWGERHFMHWLVDGDEANNNGNWQWIASVGTDPAPVFRRIYNPARQMETFDPAGRYVRRYVPELKLVPDEHLREPWKMPAEDQREAGCVIGEDYPEPIVDHAQARREALERYRV
ncbi:MAG TPA: deoxyribodipyrimidine photo-lyase [Solirubrobacteraceae bacterium]|nr:deoxyribodipyrimidine photo-lyase [Solirubrobacteraceae bacterium]